jgi:molybdenum cofactor cytidylyltransferase
VIAAVVPAAGKSTRMGRPKLALPVAGRAVIECVVGALRAGGADRVVVVVGPHVPELVPLAEAAGADVCQLAVETPDMRATVERGLAWVEEHYRPGPADAWLLAPADHPELDAAAVRAVIEAYRSDPAWSVVVPVHEGRRGHPTLIAWRHVAGIRALPAGVGINAYLQQVAGVTREVAVASAGVVCDLDTPADYERLRGT